MKYTLVKTRETDKNRMNITILKPILIVSLLSFVLFSCQEDRPLERTISSIPKINLPKVEMTKVKTSIKRGQGMFQALKALDIPHKKSIQLINELRDKVEFSKLKVGDKLVATYDSNKKLHSFTFSNSPASKHELSFNTKVNKWEYNYIEDETKWINRIVTGELKKGSTLLHDLLSTGLKRPVVANMINVLMCKVNFRLNARIKDQYKFLLRERFHKGKVIETKILYMSYKGKRAGSSESYLYNENMQNSRSIYTAHYTHKGEALIPSGLRYPVGSLHIRSGYGYRYHPVTGKRRMHRGVDLRARAGSPVYSVARGIVVESKFNKYAGNKIAIKHADGSISYYLHLRNRLIKKGKRVKAHQIIGRVGATGRVTGPHLHFGFKKPNGRWMNPMNKRMIATPKLKGARLAKLTKQIKNINSIIEDVEFINTSLDIKFASIDR